ALSVPPKAIALPAPGRRALNSRKDHVVNGRAKLLALPTRNFTCHSTRPSPARLQPPPARRAVCWSCQLSVLPTAPAVLSGPVPPCDPLLEAPSNVQPQICIRPP